MACATAGTGPFTARLAPGEGERGQGRAAEHPHSAFGEKQPNCLIGADACWVWVRKDPSRHTHTHTFPLLQLFPQKHRLTWDLCAIPSAVMRIIPAGLRNCVRSWLPCKALASQRERRSRPSPVLSTTQFHTPRHNRSFLIPLLQGDTRSCSTPKEKGCPATAAGPVKPLPASVRQIFGSASPATWLEGRPSWGLDEKTPQAARGWCWGAGTVQGGDKQVYK